METHTAIKTRLVEVNKQQMIELQTDHETMNLTLSQAALLKFNLAQLLAHVQAGGKK